jgi:WD40 repeat protein
LELSQVELLKMNANFFFFFFFYFYYFFFLFLFFFFFFFFHLWSKMEGGLFPDEILFMVVKYLESHGLESVSSLARELEQRGTWTRPLWNGAHRVLSLAEVVPARADALLALLARGTSVSSAQQRGALIFPPPPPLSGTIVALEATALECGSAAQRCVFKRLHLELALGSRLERCFAVRGHTHNVFSVAMNESGSLLASGADDGVVKIWDPYSGRLMRTLRGCSGAVVDLGFSSNGRYFAMGAEGARDGVAVFQAPRFRRCAWLPLIGGATVKLVSFFDAHGRTLLAVAFSDGRLGIYGAAPDWSLLQSFQYEAILTLGSSRNLLALGLNSGFEVLHVDEDLAIRVVAREGSLRDVMTLEWSLDAKTLFVAGMSGRPFVYALQDDETSVVKRGFNELSKLPSVRVMVQDARFSCAGTFLFVLIGDAASRNCSVIVLENATLAEVNTFPSHIESCFLIDQHPSIDEVFFTAAYDGTVRIMHARNGLLKVLRVRAIGSEEILSACWAPDGLGIALGGAHGTVCFFSCDGLMEGVPSEQFFATDYDPVIVTADLRLVGLHDQLVIDEADAANVLVRFDGSLHTSISGIPIGGHVTPAEKYRQIQNNVLDAPLVAAAAAAALGGGNQGDLGDVNDGMLVVNMDFVGEDNVRIFLFRFFFFSLKKSFFSDGRGCRL